MGLYVWTKLSLGRFVASMNSVMYWLSNPIWLGGALTITAYEVFTQFCYDPTEHFAKTGVLVTQIIFGVSFIWIATWSAILSFGVGKWIPTIGAWVRVLLLVGFTLTLIAVNFLSGAISTIFMIAAFNLTSGDTAKYFAAALGLAISTTTLSYLGIFPAL